jgi:hypothetical protein
MKLPVCRRREITIEDGIDLVCDAHENVKDCPDCLADYKSFGGLY